MYAYNIFDNKLRLFRQFFLYKYIIKEKRIHACGHFFYAPKTCYACCETIAHLNPVMHVVKPLK